MKAALIYQRSLILGVLFAAPKWSHTEFYLIVDPALASAATNPSGLEQVRDGEVVVFALVLPEVRPEAAESELIRRVTAADSEERMPPLTSGKKGRRCRF